MGLVATMAALVLGLLVASAKEFYDSQTSEVIQISANVIFLDRELAHYGPESREAREFLRRHAHPHSRSRLADRCSPEASGLEPVSVNETIYAKIQQLSPKNDAQRRLQTQALKMAASLLQSRWLMYEQSTSPIPLPMLMILVFG